MLKTPILITGSQRSGTTLLHLILNSHPNILSTDEDSFDYAFINTYLNAPWFPPFVSFKLPRYAPVLSFIKNLNGIRVIWCIRDPMDVVWSMIKLQMPLDKNNSVAWAAHPSCAQSEILNSYFILDNAARLSLSSDMNRFEQIINKKPKERNRQDCIFLGALCWKIKNEIPSLYQEQNIDFYTIRYEELVNNPEVKIKEILNYVGANWSDNVLKHHEFHDGVSIGNTPNTRPIDNSGVGGGMKNLDSEEIELIKDVCATTADKRNYKLS